MSYVDKILQPGETLVYVTRLHWFVYLPALGLVVLAIAMLALSNAAAADLVPAVQIAAAALALLAALAWLRGYVRRSTTELPWSSTISSIPAVQP